MTMGCLAAGHPAAAEESEPAWEYTGCDEHEHGPWFHQPGPAPIGAASIDFMLGGGAALPTAPTMAGSGSPYTTSPIEGIEGTVALELERTQDVGDERMRSILHTLDLDPDIASEPMPDTIELDVVGHAFLPYGSMTDEQAGRGRFILTGADPLPGDGLTGFYAQHAVTNAKFELEVPYGGTYVIEATAPAEEPIARFHTAPSAQQRDAIDTAAEEAEAAPARYITMGLGVALLVSFVWLAIDHQRKKRAGTPAGP